MYNLIYKSNFKKSLQKIKKGNSNIFSKILPILERLYDGPPFEEIYNVHSLTGDFIGFSSINITGDYRIIFSINKDSKEIILYYIGTHSELYK